MYQRLWGADMEFPKVSVIIPARNEEKFIEECIRSLMNTSYPEEKIEILVVDGVSEDGTRSVIEKMMEKNKCVKLIENLKKRKSPGLNIGIKHAAGDVILIADAHSTYPKDYILKNVQNLLNSDAHCVGGMINVKPRSDTVKAKAIAYVLSHPFGTGGAKYRLKIEKPEYVDTVPFGCYRKEVFDKLEGFNENLHRNMDIEFNLRMIRNGYKIKLFPDIVIDYYARDNYRDLWNNNFANGYWVMMSNLYSKRPFSLRHTVPMAFLIFLVFGAMLSIFSIFFTFYLSIVGLYIAIGCYLSVKAAFRLKFAEAFFHTLFSFWVLHLSYGAGSVCGAIKLLSEKLKRR